MADKSVAIDIKVNGQQAISTMGQLEDETKKFNEELKKVSTDGGKAAETVGKSMVDLQAKFEDVYGEMQPLSGRMGEMEDRMYELALAGQQGSEEFKALQQEVTRYKQVIIDTDKAVDRLAEQGGALGGALEIGSTVAAGYGAVQGAMALVGNENEELMQSMVKLQAAQSVLAGIEQLRMNLTKQSLIVTKLQSVQNWVLTGSTTALAGATTVATTGMKLFRLALIATGLGAIIVAVGLLITNFDKVSAAVIKAAQWVQGLAKEFREMGVGMQILIGYLTLGLVPAISYAIKLFEDMGVVDDEQTRKHKENIQSRISDIERQRDSYVQAKKDELAAAQERFNEEDSALNHQMKLLQANGQSTIEIEGQILENKRQSTAEQIALTEEMLAAEYKANLEILRLKAQTNDLLAGVLNAVNKEIDKAGGQDAYIKALIGTDDDLNELKDTLVKTEQEIEIFEVKVAKIRRDAAEKEKDWREGLNDEIIKGEMRKAEAIKTVSTGLAKFDLDLWNKQQQEKKDKQKQLDEEELDSRLALADKINEKAQQGLDFADNLNAIFGKNSEKAAKREFQINKTKNISDATVDGYKSVLSTFANTPTGIIGKSIAATAAGVFAASNIARIVSARYNGGSSGGGGSVSIPNTASGVGGADVGAVTNTTTSIGGDSKVFVVEQDITNTQNKIQVLENQSKL